MIFLVAILDIYALHMCIEHFYIWNGHLELDIYLFIYLTDEAKAKSKQCDPGPSFRCDHTSWFFCHFAWNYRELANTLLARFATVLDRSSNPQPWEQVLSDPTTRPSLSEVLEPVLWNTTRVIAAKMMVVVSL